MLPKSIVSLEFGQPVLVDGHPLHPINIIIRIDNHADDIIYIMNVL